MLRAIAQNVFIEPIVEDQFAGHNGKIQIPEAARIKSMPCMGTVYAISAKAKDLEFKVGDKVLYNRHVQNYHGMPKIDGKQLAQVKIEDVLAVLE